MLYIYIYIKIIYIYIYKIIVRKWKLSPSEILCSKYWATDSGPQWWNFWREEEIGRHGVPDLLHAHNKQTVAAVSPRLNGGLGSKGFGIHSSLSPLLIPSASESGRVFVKGTSLWVQCLNVDFSLTNSIWWEWPTWITA